jgi:putative transposase
MLLPTIVGYFKMNTSKRANQIRSMPGMPFWQRDYYEHVIRDEGDLQRIRDYVAGNPLSWELDQVHPGHPSKW